MADRCPSGASGERRNPPQEEDGASGERGNPPQEEDGEAGSKMRCPQQLHGCKCAGTTVFRGAISVVSFKRELWKRVLHEYLQF